MKVPMQYQSTEYDCTPTTFINALRYLLEREDIDPLIVKQIMTFSFDGVDKEGNICRGTSTTSIHIISDWINNYCESKSKGIRCQFITSDKIDLEKNKDIRRCFESGGVALVGINLNESIYHNVLVTRMDDEFVYVFDSDIMDLSNNEPDIEFFDNEPYQFNRKVTIKRLNDFEDKFYSMGNQVKRECVLITKI